MSVFKSETLIPISVTDLGPVAEELAEHFRNRNYQVECAETADQKWEVGITRGGKFKSIAGLKSLNLYHTLMTERGLQELKTALPTCEIVFDRDSALPNRRSK